MLSKEQGQTTEHPIEHGDSPATIGALYSQYGDETDSDFEIRVEIIRRLENAMMGCLRIGERMIRANAAICEISTRRNAPHTRSLRKVMRAYEQLAETFGETEARLRTMVLCKTCFKRNERYIGSAERSLLAFSNSIDAIEERIKWFGTSTAR